ncbi:hypothetical protein [Streptococcus sobrinus]|uniref:hypothetical protein n=1 Tax=Streptococcus sobrinus TaxID=1310 RepID=UPI00037DDD1A|nr:hypothetical protein [Streptococcus sobrinus]
MINLDTKAFADFKTVDKTNLSEFQGGGRIVGRTLYGGYLDDGVYRGNGIGVLRARPYLSGEAITVPVVTAV